MLAFAHRCQSSASRSSCARGPSRCAPLRDGAEPRPDRECAAGARGYRAPPGIPQHAVERFERGIRRGDDPVRRIGRVDRARKRVALLRAPSRRAFPARVPGWFPRLRPIAPPAGRRARRPAGVRRWCAIRHAAVSSCPRLSGRFMSSGSPASASASALRASSRCSCSSTISASRAGPRRPGRPPRTAR